MHCHCGTNNRAPRWTFTDPCKPEVRPGAREESASPAWLAAPAMNAHDTTKVYIWRLGTWCGLHYIGSVTATSHQEKGIIILNINMFVQNVMPSMRTNAIKVKFIIFCRLLYYGQLITWSKSHGEMRTSFVFTSGVHLFWNRYHGHQ